MNDFMYKILAKVSKKQTQWETDFARYAFTFCYPDTASMGQSIKVVEKYLRDNPNKLHEKRGGLVLDALKKAYPCKMP